jgi:protein SCO1/2
MSERFVGGPFSLVNHFGDVVSNETFIGSYVLLYFGFTHCRVICPRALTRLSKAMDNLGGLVDRVTPLFITVDPARDTPQVMRIFLEQNYPHFLGLTGSQEKIDAMRGAYKVFAKRLDDGAEPDGYTVSHTAFAYFLNPSGEYLTHFVDTLDEDQVADRIRRLLKSDPDGGYAQTRGLSFPPQ